MRIGSSLFSFLLLACLGLGVIAPTPALAALPAIASIAPAGKVDLIEGDVHIFDNQKKPRTVHVGDKLFEGDNIVTGKDGEVHLTMEDAGYLAVRPNTNMRIDQYRAQGDERDHGVFGLVSGSLRSITGWIGKYHPKSYLVQTPTATIGIRGTDHEPKVIPAGSSEGEAGTYDKVNIGGTKLTTPDGNSVDITPNHAGFASSKPGSVPRVLDSIPGFFKPTRNEHLMEGKHDQIQHNVDKLLEQRRQQVKDGTYPKQAGIKAEQKSDAKGASASATAVAAIYTAIANSTDVSTTIASLVAQGNDPDTVASVATIAGVSVQAIESALPTIASERIAADVSAAQNDPSAFSPAAASGNQQGNQNQQGQQNNGNSGGNQGGNGSGNFSGGGGGSAVSKS